MQARNGEVIGLWRYLSAENLRGKFRNLDKLCARTNIHFHTENRVHLMELHVLLGSVLPLLSAVEGLHTCSIKIEQLQRFINN